MGGKTGAKLLYDEAIAKASREFSAQEVAQEKKKARFTEKAILQCAFREKHKKYPTNPKTPDNIDLTNPKFHNTVDSKPYLLFNEVVSVKKNTKKHRIIAYCSENQLKILEASEQWHIDGTFYTAPKMFYQIYTISAWIHEEMFTCAHIMLPSKERDVYVVTLEKLREHAKARNITLAPKRGVSDFEFAAIGAMEKVIGNKKFKINKIIKYKI